MMNEFDCKAESELNLRLLLHGGSEEYLCKKYQVEKADLMHVILKDSKPYWNKVYSDLMKLPKRTDWEETACRSFIAAYITETIKDIVKTGVLPYYTTPKVDELKMEMYSQLSRDDMDEYAWSVVDRYINPSTGLVKVNLEDIAF